MFLRTAASPWLLQRTIIQCQWSFLSHAALHTLSISTDTHSACLQAPQSAFFSYSQISPMSGVQKFSKLLAPQGWYKADWTLGIHKYEEPLYKIWSPGVCTPAGLCQSFPLSVFILFIRMSSPFPSPPPTLLILVHVSREIRWPRLAARINKNKGLFRVLVGKHEGKRRCVGAK